MEFSSAFSRLDNQEIKWIDFPVRLHASIFIINVPNLSYTVVSNDDIFIKQSLPLHRYFLLSGQMASFLLLLPLSIYFRWDPIRFIYYY